MVCSKHLAHEAEASNILCLSHSRDGSKALGREEVVQSAVGAALGGSLLLVLACAAGSS